ncbi:hypothetical protein BFJ68_g17221 [Fusarium oxysporum]|uniref:FAD-binding PCMH-type domain-containing protein n=1 Tax=Fusarium oxysporum TaxID=5507 RepID=A0A420NZJ1_FUSOX|nr:hypothetical protein BFJ68_g17221 [Fusarium oxysporum]
MHLFQLKVFTAVVVWSLTSAGATIPLAGDELAGKCPITDVDQLGKKLSKAAKIFFPGSNEFLQASTRWSVLEVPKVNIVVVPGTEKDVAETVKFANKKAVPLLAFNTAHGAITTLGRMDHGIEIYLSQLNDVKISPDGKTVEIGGGTVSKKVTDTLWAAGKQTGGHGWLQGHHGIIADQILTMNVVLADGSFKMIDQRSDLFWAMKGAGHNFGIVTSVTAKIYDIEHRDWAIETLVFSGDQVGEVYQAANEHLLRKQPVGVINWSYWLNNPDADPNNPFRDIGPLSIEPVAGDYKDLAGWTGISLSSPPCQKDGHVNPRFPLYLQSYNVPAMEKAYKFFASEIGGDSPFNGSLFMFESYSTQGVRDIDSKSTAFAFRDANLLIAPLITYKPAGPNIDKRAADLGIGLRNILHKASSKEEMGVYVNYAFGDENAKQLYGNEAWRQQKLRGLKKKYDPKGKFSFFGPVA